MLLQRARKSLPVIGQYMAAIAKLPVVQWFAQAWR
jgi:hypothetical protein